MGLAGPGGVTGVPRSTERKPTTGDGRLALVTHLGAVNGRWDTNGRTGVGSAASAAAAAASGTLLSYGAGPSTGPGCSDRTAGSSTALSTGSPTRCSASPPPPPRSGPAGRGDTPCVDGPLRRRSPAVIGSGPVDLPETPRAVGPLRGGTGGGRSSKAASPPSASGPTGRPDSPRQTGPLRSPSSAPSGNGPAGSRDTPRQTGPLRVWWWWGSTVGAAGGAKRSPVERIPSYAATGAATAGSRATGASRVTSCARGCSAAGTDHVEASPARNAR